MLKCLAQMMLVTEFMPGNDLGTCIRKDVSVPRVTGWYCRGQSILLGIARYIFSFPISHSECFHAVVLQALVL